MGVRLLLAALIMVASDAASGQESDCTRRLADMSRMMRSAADSAKVIDLRAPEVATCRNLVNPPPLYLETCERRQDELASAVRSLASNLESVEATYRQVGPSCERSIQGDGRPAEPRLRRLCPGLLSKRGYLLESALLKQCLVVMSEIECRECLAR